MNPVPRKYRPGSDPSRAFRLKADRRLRVLATVFLIVTTLVSADEIAWVADLALSLERDRQVAEALDASRLQTGTRLPDFTLKAQAPAEYNATDSSWSVKPSVGVAIVSPGPTSYERFFWNLFAGGEVDLGKNSGYNDVVLSITPTITAETSFRFAQRSKDSLPPGEVLRGIELSGRKRDLDEKSLASFLEACSLASLSATYQSDGLKSQADAQYLELNLRRMEVLMEGGAVTGAAYRQEKDAYERAKASAGDAFFEAGRLGREVRARSRRRGTPVTTEAPAADGGTPAHDYFADIDLYEIALRLEPLMAQAAPVPAAIAVATAGWDLRIAEIVATDFSTAPLLTVSLEGSLGFNERDNTPAPVISGSLNLDVPLGPERATRRKSLGDLQRLRDSVAQDAGENASRRLGEYQRLLETRKERIAFYSRLQQESKRLTDVYQRLLEEGVVTRIDRLGAERSLKEVEAFLSRARAGYFLDIVTAVVSLRIPMKDIVEAVTSGADTQGTPGTSSSEGSAIQPGAQRSPSP